jgi:hypothetical protein
VIAAKGDYQPNMTATFDYKGANSQGFVSTSDEWVWHWTAGVGLRWDVWDGGRRSGVAWEKALELEKMKAMYEDLKRTVRLQVRQAHLELEHARQAVEAGGDSVALAERALDIARVRHKSGLSTYLEFTDSNLALSTARLSYSQALRDDLNAKARLAFRFTAVVLGETLGHVFCDANVEALANRRPHHIAYVWLAQIQSRQREGRGKCLGLRKLVAGVGFEPTTFRL